MATLTPTLTITSTDAYTDTLSLSTTIDLTLTAPTAGISKVSSAADPLGAGAGILIAEADATATTYVYVKHLGLLASDGTTASHASNDFIRLSNADGDHDFIKLQPSEFAFFPLLEFDGSDGGVEPGGLKVEAGSAAVMIEFGYWTKG